MLALIAAVISAIATIAAAVITTRRTGPAGAVPVAATVEGAAVPVAAAPVSKAFWLGLAGLILWIIPIAAYLAVIPGLYVGIREHDGPRRRTTAGIVLCALSLGLAAINSAIGAYQGAHGQLWFQR